MNKKFLSAILFGALMVTSTGTFVSCKDYDDDIDNLQTQIDKLATKEDMTSQIATLQSALTTAQSEATAAKAAAEQALAKINNAETAATEAEKAAAQAALDAANAKVEAIKAAQAEVAKVKAELEAAIAANFEAEKKELAVTITTLKEKVEELTNLSTEMITSIDLQSVNGGKFVLDLNYYQIDVNKTWGTAKSETYTFGKDLTGSFTVSAGEIFATPSSLMVSVAPANAALPSEILSIVDSEGTSINSYINLTTKSYEGKLETASRAATNGLYTITAEVKKDADKAAFAKLLNNGKTGTELRYTAFAIAATSKDRTVTSTYDITVASATTALTVAEDIDTRSTIKSTIEKEGTLNAWNGYKGQTPSTTATPNDENCYPVANGEEFTIKVAAKADKVANQTSSKVLASYVIVDMENKALSTTDKAAISGLTITGDVNTVSKENVFDIAIGGDYSKGVVVPLKVVTIDYTGFETSRVVWVKAGNKSTIAQTAQYVVTPAYKVANAAAAQNYNYSGKASFTVPADADKFDLSIYAENEINIAVEKAAVINNSTFTFLKADGKSAAEIKDIVTAQLNATLNLQTMKDGKVYEGIVKFFDVEGAFLSQSTVSIQKVLPTTVPAGFSVKTNQLNANNIYNCYLVPTSWAASNADPNTNSGTMEMSQIFNFGKDANGNSLEAGYEITFAASAWDATDKKNIAQTKLGSETLSVASAYINSKDEHATSVVYNYGPISTETKNAQGAIIDFKVDAKTTFNTVFNCIYNDTYTWRWATRSDLGATYTAKNEDGSYKEAMPYSTVLTYGTDATKEAKYVLGRSAWDGIYNATLAAFYKNGNDVSLAVKEIHLVSDGNKEVDEYFTVTLSNGTLTFDPTKTSSETNPTAAVASTLVVTVYDMYGHEFDIKVPMTVNKR